MSDEIVSHIWLAAHYGPGDSRIIGTIPVRSGKSGLYYEVRIQGELCRLTITETTKECAHKHIPARFGDGGLTVADFPGFEAGEDGNG